MAFFQGLRDLAAQQNQTNFLGVRRGDKAYADKTMAALTSLDYEDFLQDYQPLLLEQLGQIGDQDYKTQQVDAARQRVQQGLAALPAQRERLLASYGQQMTPEEQAVTAKGDALRGSLADVTAINRTSQAIEDRDWRTLAGGRSPRAGLSSLQGGGS